MSDRSDNSFSDDDDELLSDQDHRDYEDEEDDGSSSSASEDVDSSARTVPEVKGRNIQNIHKHTETYVQSASADL